MDKKDINNAPVTEEDYDLFYGFVDSVFEEKKRFEEPEKKDTLAVTEPEWTPEPFEEFIVGMPQQESGKYYALNIVSPDSTTALASDIHPNHYGTISGIITSITISAALLFALYFFTTEPDPTPEIVSNSQLSNIAESLQAVESKIQSVQTLESQVKNLVTQLDKLNTSITATRSRETKPAVAITTPWVVNLASFRSIERAKSMLAEVQGMGIAAESFPVNIQGKAWIRIRLTGFRSRFEAKQALIELGKIISPKSLWVGRQ